MEGLSIHRQVGADIDIPNDVEVSGGSLGIHTHVTGSSVNMEGLSIHRQVGADIDIPNDVEVG